MRRALEEAISEGPPQSGSPLAILPLQATSTCQAVKSLLKAVVPGNRQHDNQQRNLNGAISERINLVGLSGKEQPARLHSMHHGVVMQGLGIILLRIQRDRIHKYVAANPLSEYFLNLQKVGCDDRAFSFAVRIYEIDDHDLAFNQIIVEADFLAFVDLKKTYEQHRGQQVEMTLVVTETNVGVYLAPLHIRLAFRRLKDIGLGPPSTSHFCESSYEEYIAAERRKAEKQRAVGDQIRERAEADPQISEILKSLRKKDSEESTSKPRQEVRSYTIPDLTEQPVTLFDSWSAEKKQLFQRVAAIASKEVKEVFCESGGTTRIIVPDFSVGDPSIYVLVEPPATDNASIDETSILSIQFSRSASTGKYDAYLGKTFGLPGELDWYRPLIENRRAKELNIICRKRRIG